MMLVFDGNGEYKFLQADRRGVVPIWKRTLCPMTFEEGTPSLTTVY